MPERDSSAYGWGQRASYLACGAAVENIVLAASVERMRADIALLPDIHDPWHVATITLTPDPSTVPHPLASAIMKRGTNRKAYRTEPLTVRERDMLMAAAGEDATATLVEERSGIKTLARVGSTNEEIMLANRALHQFFFSHVSWTKEQDDARKVGFYIKTLELPPPAQLLFKIFRHWSVMRLLAMLGFNRFVARQNAATNAAAAAIGVVRINATRPIDFINAGRATERLWLTAVTLGFSFQPLTGILFFKLKLAHGEGDAFSPPERARIEHAYARAAALAGITSGHLAFMFRIGKSDPPTARAIRFPLDQAVTIS